MIKSTPFGSLSFSFLGLGIACNSFSSHIIIFPGINFPILLILTSLMFLGADVIIKCAICKINIDIVMPFILSAWAILSLIWTKSIDYTLSFSYYYVICAVLYFLVRYHANNCNRWVHLGLWFVSGGIVGSILLLVNWRLGITVDGFRVTIGEMNSNYVAYSLATSAAIAVVLYHLSRYSVAIISIFVFIIVLYGFGILLTGCRSALLAYLMLLSTLVVISNKNKLLSSIIYIMVFIFIITISLYYVPVEFRSRIVGGTMISQVGLGGNSLSGRLFTWPIAYELFKENIFFGVGAGVFQSLNPEGFGVHNVFLSVAVELGLIGFLYYLFIIFWISYPLLFIPFRRQVMVFILLTWGIISMAGVWEVSLAAWFAFAWMASTPQILNNRLIYEGNRVSSHVS